MSVYPSYAFLSMIYGLITAGDLVLALYKGDPLPTGTGPEVSGGSYARQLIEFGSLVDGFITNNAVITFSQLPTAKITHWAIFESNTGVMKVYGALDNSVDCVVGDEINFPVGNLSIGITGS